MNNLIHVALPTATSAPVPSLQLLTPEPRGLEKESRQSPNKEPVVHKYGPGNMQHGRKACTCYILYIKVTQNILCKLAVKRTLALGKGVFSSFNYDSVHVRGSFQGPKWRLAQTIISPTLQKSGIIVATSPGYFTLGIHSLCPMELTTLSKWRFS